MVTISGGKLLGQGTYGCVFHPSLKCYSSDVNNKTLETGVSKVFKKQKDMIEELYETKKIKKMDNKGKYTNRVLGSCSVSSSRIDKQDREECRFSKNLGISNKKLHQIIYEHKGIDLNQFFKSTPPFSIEETFHYIYNLLKGIKILVENKYIHLDLKPDNILITDTNKAKTLKP
jgi:serine/threonine protein kinase